MLSSFPNVLKTFRHFNRRVGIMSWITPQKKYPLKVCYIISILLIETRSLPSSLKPHPIYLGLASPAIDVAKNIICFVANLIFATHICCLSPSVCGLLVRVASNDPTQPNPTQTLPHIDDLGCPLFYLYFWVEFSWVHICCLSPSVWWFSRVAIHDPIHNPTKTYHVLTV